MEHKRDATVAGLAWPSNPNRGLAPTNPDQAPDAPASALCHSGLPDPTTGTPSAPLAADSTTTDIGTTAHSDTYSGLAPPDVPFPTEQSPPNVVILSTTFTVFRATGSGHCAQRIIGDIILRFL